MLVKGRGVIVKINFDMGAYLKVGLIEGMMLNRGLTAEINMLQICMVGHTKLTKMKWLDMKAVFAKFCITLTIARPLLVDLI